MAQRAVTYARVSGNDLTATGGANLADQTRLCREYAQGKGYLVVAELAEDERGASGALLDLPQLTHALEMARNREFDVLIVREVDRLARDMAKQFLVEQELKQAGVAIEYALYDFPQTPEGRLQKNLYAMFAEYEREKLYQRMARGKRRKARGGDPAIGGRPPYGYRIVPVDEQHKQLEVIPDQAEAVRLIFQRFAVDHWSTAAIASELNARGFAAPGDAEPHKYSKERAPGWTFYNLYHILRREAYTGHYPLYRTHWEHYVDRAGQPRKRQVKRPQEDWVYITAPAIISHELYEQAQAILARRDFKVTQPQKNSYLMGHGRLTCSRCGYKLISYTVRKKSGQTYSYYRCAGHLQVTAHSCDMPSYPAVLVDAQVWEFVLQLVTDEAFLRQQYEFMRNQQTQELLPLRARLETLDNEIATYQGKLKTLLSILLTANDMERDLLQPERERLNRYIASLTAQRAAISEQVQAIEITSEQIEDVVRVTAWIRQAQTDLGTQEFSIKRQIIEVLNVRGITELRDGQRIIVIMCDLGEGLISLDMSSDQFAHEDLTELATKLPRLYATIKILS